MLAAKVVARPRRVRRIGGLKVKLARDEDEGDLHLDHGEAFAETGAGPLFEAAEGVLGRFGVVAGEEAVGAEGEGRGPEVGAAAEAVVRDPEDVAGERERGGGVRVGHGLDGGGGEGHAHGGAGGEEAHRLFDAGRREGQVVDEGRRRGEQGPGLGRVGCEDGVVLGAEPGEDSWVRREEEDGVGDRRRGRVVAAQQDRFDVVDGDEHEIGVEGFAAVGSFLVFGRGPEFVFVVGAQGEVDDRLVAAVVEGSGLVPLDNGLLDLLVQQSAVPPLGEPAFERADDVHRRACPGNHPPEVLVEGGILGLRVEILAQDDLSDHVDGCVDGPFLHFDRLAQDGDLLQAIAEEIHVLEYNAGHEAHDVVGSEARAEHGAKHFPLGSLARDDGLGSGHVAEELLVDRVLGQGFGLRDLSGDGVVVYHHHRCRHGPQVHVKHWSEVIFLSQSGQWDVGMDVIGELLHNGPHLFQMSPEETVRRTGLVRD